MIAVEINDQDLRAPVSENRTGVWCFAVTHVNGKPLPFEERIFFATGNWDNAKAKAQGYAKTKGCAEDVDSILLLAFGNE